MDPLVILLVDELVISPMHARRVLNMIVGYIGDELAILGKTQIVGLGTFSVVTPAGRPAVSFRAAKMLRKKLTPPAGVIGGAVQDEDTSRVGAAEPAGEGRTDVAGFVASPHC